MHPALKKWLNGRFWGLLLLITLSLVTLPEDAFASVGGLSLSFSGRVFAPAPCKINNDETINIPFGKISINKIDGKNYAITKILSITCDAGTLAPLQLQIQGEGVISRANVLQTNIKNLGVALYNAGSSQGIQLNQFFNIARDTSFSLQLIPVKINDTADISEGGFVATATIVSKFN
ncbi:fimbrial protein [Serratia sp. UGAL515B_01]|uniref:fimbrial protein n=1 Tax=Serratia sp. UGAL515B_01 TaxID=2986763 RepID=UPI00295565A5|nr:fimbrial protein [Serratia sp. UGAL515B_01]WON78396.1 fimbrial protein [Serratia sp. UGAL515B_01]